MIRFRGLQGLLDAKLTVGRSGRAMLAVSESSLGRVVLGCSPLMATEASLSSTLHHA